MDNENRIKRTIELSNQPLTVEDYQSALELVVDMLRELVYCHIEPMTTELRCYYCDCPMEDDYGFPTDIQHTDDCVWKLASDFVKERDER